MISVIVPIYNSGKYLSGTLSSILSQTYTDIEIICVNDGSTDNSAEILKNIAEQDSRIKILTQTNSGVSSARNTGLDNAHGDFITFVDSDDELEPDMYEILSELANRYGADITHCGYKKIYKDLSSKNICGTGILIEQNANDAVSCLLRGQHFTGSLCNKLYRADLIRDIRFDKNLKINEDVLFNVQAFLKTKKTVFYDIPKYRYFEREGSSCSRTDKLKKCLDCADAAKKITELCSGSELESEAAKKYYYNLTDLYRAYLFCDIKNSRNERKEIAQILETLKPSCGSISKRNAFNYAFMHRLPVIYKFLYKIYDSVRKPNWDI